MKFDVVPHPNPTDPAQIAEVLKDPGFGAHFTDHTAVIETELRWSFTPRWAAIGYIGAGRAWGKSTDFGEAPSAVSKGVGFRYLIARRLGLWVGMDYARGPESSTWYIQVGNAWR